MLNNIFNNFENEDIITKSQVYEKIQPNKILGDSFAKTINYHGIHSNFTLDIPEILEEEKRQQERKEDISRFTKLAISNPENNSHNELVRELLSDEEILNVYLDDAISTLSFNEQLLADLSL